MPSRQRLKKKLRSWLQSKQCLETPDHLDHLDQRDLLEKMDRREMMERQEDLVTQDQRDPKVRKEILDHKVHPEQQQLAVMIRVMYQKLRVLPYLVVRESLTI